MRLFLCSSFVYWELWTYFTYFWGSLAVSSLTFSSTLWGILLTFCISFLNICIYAPISAVLSTPFCHSSMVFPGVKGRCYVYTCCFMSLVYSLWKGWSCRGTELDLGPSWKLMTLTWADYLSFIRVVLPVFLPKLAALTLAPAVLNLILLFPSSLPPVK